MALYALSDLHLDLSGSKPMEVFGEKWYKHDQNIKNNWMNEITNDDTILIAGDVSWAMSMDESINELEWIHQLSGRKIFVKGNHDYWSTSIKKLNDLYEDMDFIQNNFFTYKDYAICGSRGWIMPSSDDFTQHDNKVYKREIIRLKLSFDSAVKNGYNKIIAMIHYPPITDKQKQNEFTELFNEYGVCKVIYGHLHGVASHNAFEGINNGVEYILTSSDYLDFKPTKILE